MADNDAFEAMSPSPEERAFVDSERARWDRGSQSVYKAGRFCPASCLNFHRAFACSWNVDGDGVLRNRGY